MSLFGERTAPAGVVRDTLAEAQAFIERNVDEGVHCPCCGRLAKRYKRGLNAIMAGSLCWLAGEHVHTGAAWIDVPMRAPRFILRTQEISGLVHWDLVRTLMNEDRKKRASGMWQLTERGWQFVRGELRVPAYVWLYQNKVRGWSEETIDVHEALRKKFDYAELMSNRVGPEVVPV